MEVKQTGVIWWSQYSGQSMDSYECRVLKWDKFDNYAGKPCRIPREWLGMQRGKGDEFIYEARRSTEPRSLGDGFIYGFNYQGEWTGSIREKVEGEGYVEQMGKAFF